MWLEVDLGEARLVSGIQSQGPPLPLHNAAYMRYIRCCSPSLHCSTPNPPPVQPVGVAQPRLSPVDRLLQRGWQQVAHCRVTTPQSLTRTSFYADDKTGESGVVTTHPFNKLLAARYSTNLTPAT